MLNYVCVKTVCIHYTEKTNGSYTRRVCVNERFCIYSSECVLNLVCMMGCHVQKGARVRFTY